MPLVILHHLLNVSVQLANERGITKNMNGVGFETTTSVSEREETIHALGRAATACAVRQLVLLLYTTLIETASVI
jgi:hypothetical protein